MTQRMMYRSVVLWFWFVAICFSGSFFAQAHAAERPIGQLRVVITDDTLDELPIAGATLRLSGDSLIGGAQERIGNDNGEMLFTELSPGLYKVVVTKAGFNSMTVDKIQVNINRTTIQTVKLAAGNGSVVEVIAKQKAVNVMSTSAGTEVSSLAEHPLYDSDLDFNSWLEGTEDWSRANHTSHRRLNLTDRRILSVQDPSGHPVAGARVVIVDPKRDRAVTTAITHRDGRVVFFPHSMPGTGGPYRVVVDGKVTKWDGLGDIVIPTKARGQTPEPIAVDVLLVIDTTSTMREEVAGLREHWSQLLDIVALQKPAIDLRMGFVFYRDRGESYVAQTTPLTRDLVLLSRTLSETTCGGGGDAPEALEAALAEIGSQSWRPEAEKLVFLWSDAAPHLDGGDPPYTDSARSALSNGIALFPVAASNMPPSGAYIFRQLAELTGGRALFSIPGAAYALHEVIPDAIDRAIDSSYSAAQ